MSNTNEGLIHKKMVEVMASIGPVSKDRKNEMQNFKFRGIDQFINALHPALVKAGVYIVPSVVSTTSDIREIAREKSTVLEKHVNVLMNYSFVAEDGSRVTVGPIAAEGIDRGDKATNKALSAALKYALIQTFAVPTEDMAEADFDTATTISKNETKDSPLALVSEGAPPMPNSSGRPRTFKKTSAVALESVAEASGDNF